MSTWAITISGGKLAHEFGYCQVFAPSTHALPEIACVKVKGKDEDSDTKILITKTESRDGGLPKTKVLKGLRID